MTPTVPQHVLDWCNDNGYDKPSVIAGISGIEYWAIAPGSFMPERLPLSLLPIKLTLSFDTSPFHEAVRSFQVVAQSESLREATQQFQNSAENLIRVFRDGIEQIHANAGTQTSSCQMPPLTVLDYLVEKSAALISRDEDESDRAFIERQFALNPKHPPKHPGRSLPKALVNIRIQEFCQAHRLTEKQLATMLNAGTVKVKLGRLQPAKGFKPVAAPSIQ